MAYLNTLDGVHNLRDSLKGGQPEIKLTLKPQAQHLGFSAQDLAIQVSNHFGGAEAQRVARLGSEVKVRVQTKEQARNSWEDLMSARIKSSTGHWFALNAVANISTSYTSSYVERSNGKRVNNVHAYIDNAVVSGAEVSESVFASLVPVLKEKYPDVKISAGGELAETGEIKSKLKTALLITCILIYVLMAIPLRSYVQPFVIMSVVPFGFLGAAIGHLIMDVPLSLLSFFGMLALTGIVVNDSLVMVSRYNKEREEGKSIEVALHCAGVGRFQAVFLTTVTTVVGLMPLMAETSEQAQYLIPAAISLAYGEIFATAITLILIPVLIAINEDIKKTIQKERD